MTMHTVRPTSLSLEPQGTLLIAWSDGLRRRYALRELRESCPCATCREQRSQPPQAVLLPVLSARDLAPLKLNGAKPVGQYAYSLEFSDGHDTGIFTFDLLRELGEVVA